MHFQCAIPFLLQRKTSLLLTVMVNGTPCWVNILSNISIMHWLIVDVEVCSDVRKSCGEMKNVDKTRTCV